MSLNPEAGCGLPMGDVQSSISSGVRSSLCLMFRWFHVMYGVNSGALEIPEFNQSKPIEGSDKVEFVQAIKALKLQAAWR